MSFAVVFAGQGSQSLGMLSSFGSEPVIQQTFQEASDVLGYDLLALAQNDADAINQTIHTQPLMLTAGVALWRVWQAQTDSKPSVLAGHSLGEYTAWVAAGALPFSAAVQLVRTRAELMQNAVPEGEGAMAAVLGLDDDKVIAVCEELSTPNAVVEAVNFNAPGQVVIAGHKAAVEQASVVLKEQGARRAQILPVSVPSHSSLMKEASALLSDALNAVDISPAQMDVVQNVSGDCLTSPKTVPEQTIRMDAMRAGLIQQLYSPVLWVRSVNTLLATPVDAIVELGGGKVLTGLNKRIAKAANSDVTLVHADSPESLALAVQSSLSQSTQEAG